MKVHAKTMPNSSNTYQVLIDCKKRSDTSR